MRPNGTPKNLERRRRKAVALLQQGLTLAQVARRVGSTAASVCRWQQAYAQDGEQALRAKPVPGRPPKLDPKQLERLWDILLEGALAYGYPNDLWTLNRMARVIRKQFGVRYHPGHVWKILRSARWSCQVPERRAIQRDDDAIAHWKRYQWPAIKKKGRKTGRPPGFPR